jgi:phosphate transport system protein
VDKPTYLEARVEQDIQALRTRVRKMADLALAQVEDAVAAFTDDNRGLAYRVVLRDHRIDMLEDHIDRLCQEFLVRHMPVAAQLRFVVAVVKVNAELERIGDYAEGIARRVVTIAGSDVMVPERQRILEMSTVAGQMLRHAVKAFLDGDTDAAARTLESDRRVDAMNSDMFKALSDPASNLDLQVRFALLGLTNRIERIADRACNIAEEAIYAVRGQVVRHLPREDIRVLFLCDHNSCRSQMAEGIARHLAPANFIFSSAGVTPTAIDARAVAFLAKHSIDISRQRSKSLSDVGQIEDFHIVVTLSQAAEADRPEAPYHSVVLNWDIPDPSKTIAEGVDADAAYLAVYETLNDKIKDMTDGLVGAYEMEDDQ